MDFHLLFKGDIILVTALTLIYLVYSYAKKIKTDKVICYVLACITAFFFACLFLNAFLAVEEVKGIAGLLVIPALVLCYVFAPVQKNKKEIRLAIFALLLYLLFWIVLYTLHYYSEM